MKKIFYSLLGLAILLPPSFAADHRVFSEETVNEVMKRVERNGDRFKDDFKDMLNNNKLFFTDHENDRVKNWAEDLEDTVDQMQEEFSEKDYEKSRQKLEASLMIASGLNRLMLRSYVGDKARGSWEALRADLNALAVAFELPVLPNILVTTVIR
jgi:hypothetical protein